MGFKPPSLCAGNESISVGLQAGVSGEIRATNACTWMYRLAFIAEHGLRSYKACRAALSRVSDGIGVANASTWMYWPGFLWSKDCVTKSEWLRARLNRFISTTAWMQEVEQRRSSCRGSRRPHNRAAFLFRASCPTPFGPAKAVQN